MCDVVRENKETETWWLGWRQWHAPCCQVSSSLSYFLNYLFEDCIISWNI